MGGGVWVQFKTPQGSDGAGGALEGVGIVFRLFLSGFEFLIYFCAFRLHIHGARQQWGKKPAGILSRFIDEQCCCRP